jgi:hypothetical protein
MHVCHSSKSGYVPTAQLVYMQVVKILRLYASVIAAAAKYHKCHSYLHCCELINTLLLITRATTTVATVR